MKLQIPSYERMSKAIKHSALIEMFAYQSMETYYSRNYVSSKIFKELNLQPTRTQISRIIDMNNPRNNVLKHVCFMFLIRCFPERTDNMRRFVPYPIYWRHVRERSVDYVNIPLYASLGLPLLNSAALARTAEVSPGTACILSVHAPWVKDVQFNSNDPNIIAFASRDINNLVDELLKKRKWLDMNDTILNIAVLNPFLTCDSARKILTCLLKDVQDLNWFGSPYAAECIARLCMNTSIPLDFFTEFAEHVQNFLYRRSDFPSEKIPYNSILYTNSTAKHIDRYIAQHFSVRDRLQASRHPNMSDKTYNKLLSSKRYRFVEYMLYNDRTDTFNLLRFQKEYPEIVETRFDIERLNNVLMPVLERQLKAAENYETFFPKTMEEFDSVLNSFIP